MLLCCMISLLRKERVFKHANQRRPQLKFKSQRDLDTLQAERVTIKLLDGQKVKVNPLTFRCFLAIFKSYLLQKKIVKK